MNGEASLLEKQEVSAEAESLVEHRVLAMVEKGARFLWRHITSEYCSVNCKVQTVVTVKV